MDGEERGEALTLKYGHPHFVTCHLQCTSCAHGRYTFCLGISVLLLELHELEICSEIGNLNSLDII